MEYNHPRQAFVICCSSSVKVEYYNSEMILVKNRNRDKTMNELRRNKGKAIVKHDHSFPIYRVA